jgi:hypothetical protein
MKRFPEMYEQVFLMYEDKKDLIAYLIYNLYSENDRIKYAMKYDCIEEFAIYKYDTKLQDLNELYNLNYMPTQRFIETLFNKHYDTYIFIDIFKKFLYRYNGNKDFIISGKILEQFRKLNKIDSIFMEYWGVLIEYGFDINWFNETDIKQSKNIQKILAKYTNVSGNYTWYERLCKFIGLNKYYKIKLQ